MTINYLDSKRISALGSTDKETIALDTRASESNSGTQGTTMTLDVTIGTGSKRALFVCLNTDPNVTVSHIKLDGVAFTEISGTVRTDVGKNSIWQLINPASGTGTITVTWGASAGYVGMSAISFTGVDQTTPVNTSNITSSYVSTGGSGVQTVSITPANTGSAIFGYVITQRNVLTSTGSGSIASTFLPKGETSSTLGGAGFSQYDLSPTIGSANNLVVYTHNTATTNQDRVIIEINAGTLADVKPTNVQDNSILVEKDTGRRYWFSEAVAPTFEDDFDYATQSAADAAWVSTDTAINRVNITDDDLDFKADGSVSSKDKISYDLTSISTLFLSRFSVDFTTMTASGGSGTKAFFGVTEGSVYDSTENHIGFWVREQASTANDMGIKTGVGGDWSSGGATTLFSTVPSVTKYYVELKRTSATSITLSLYSDSNYSTLVETATSTISATGSLRYFSIQTSDSSSASSAIIGTFNDFKFYDGVTSATPATWTGNFDLTGLKAYYKFDEASGNIINQHTTGDGLASADLTTTGVTYGVTGVISTAVSCDGSNDFMVSPSATKTDFNFIHALNQAWSINIWFKKANANDGGITALIANRVGSDVGIRIKNLDRSGSGETRKLQLEIDSGSAGSAVAMYDSNVDSFFPNDTDWHMLTITADNSITTNAMQIYLDGILNHNVNRVGVGDGGTPEYPMNFAQEGDGTDYGDYTFDETSFWTRKLSSTDVTSLYNSGKGKIIY